MFCCEVVVCDGCDLVWCFDWYFDDLVVWYFQYVCVGRWFFWIVYIEFSYVYWCCIDVLVFGFMCVQYDVVFYFFDLYCCGFVGGWCVIVE